MVEAEEGYDNDISPKLLDEAFTKYNRSISQYYFDYLVMNKRQNLIMNEILIDTTTSKTAGRKSKKTKLDRQRVHETRQQQDDIDHNYDNDIVVLIDDVKTGQPPTAPVDLGFFETFFDFFKWIVVSVLYPEMYDEKNE